jgi:hypothetical protein
LQEAGQSGLEKGTEMSNANAAALRNAAYREVLAALAKLP